MSSGPPPSPSVMYAVPWNEMSFGPPAVDPSGSAWEGMPSATRDCLPFHNRVTAPVGP